mgnify:FL=1
MYENNGLMYFGKSLKILIFLKNYDIVNVCNEFRRTEMRNLKKMFILCSLALVFTVVFADASFAQEGGNGLMNVAAGKAVRIFNHVKMIIFVVGGFGLVGIAFQTIFGKVKWTWFAGLAVGLAILAAAGAIVNYATGDTMGKSSTAGAVKDTFGDSDDGSFTR